MTSRTVSHVMGNFLVLKATALLEARLVSPPIEMMIMMMRSFEGETSTTIFMTWNF